MSGEDVTGLRVWLDEQIAEADRLALAVPFREYVARGIALREVRDRLTPDASGYRSWGESALAFRHGGESPCL